MNLPNKLSIFRIILVPFIVLIFLFPYDYLSIQPVIFSVGSINISIVQIICLILFVIASITDFIDGYLARKNDLVTSLGKFLDPIADKLLVNTLLILLACTGALSLIPVLIMIWRDVIVDGIRMLAAKNDVVMAADFSGKLKTVFQMLTIIFALLGDLPFSLISIPISEILVWICALISLYSGIEYFNKAKKFILESK